MDMKVLQIVILALIAAYPEDVLCARKSMREQKKGYKGPCGQKYLRMINNKCYYVSVKKVSSPNRTHLPSPLAVTSRTFARFADELVWRAEQLSAQETESGRSVVAGRLRGADEIPENPRQSERLLVGWE